MKFRKILKISLQRVRYNRKRNLTIAIPIILIVVLLLIVNMVYYSMQQYVKSIENNLSLRTIDYINCLPSKYEETKEKLQQLEHIDMVVEMDERHVYAEAYCEQLKSETYSGQTTLAPINKKTCPEVIMGRQINEEDEYVVIVPDKILDSSNTNFEFDSVIVEQKDLENQYIDGTALLGEQLKIEFKEFDSKATVEKNFTVIGVFDSELYNEKTNFYVPKSIIKEINQEIEYAFVDKFFKVVVDKLENVQSVYDEIYSDENIEKTKIELEAGANENSTNVVEQNILKVADINLDTQKLINSISTYFMIGIILIFAVLLIITNMNKTYLSSTEMGILRVEGYTNKDIQKITIIENIIVCVLSIMIGILLFGLLRIFANAVIDYIIQKPDAGITMNEIRKQLYYLMKIPQKVNAMFIIVSSVIITAIVGLNTYFINKKQFHKHIKDLLKS